mgnify:CR=1 FL=1
MEHSPTPWRKRRPDSNFLVDANVHIIAHVFGDLNQSTADYDATVSERISLIIRAVNAHADYEAALREIARVYDEEYDREEEHPDIQAWASAVAEWMADTAKAALAKHKETP